MKNAFQTCDQRRVHLIALPVQKFNRDLAEIGEISARFVLSQRSRRDLAEISAR